MLDLFYRSLIDLAQLFAEHQDVFEFRRDLLQSSASAGGPMCLRVHGRSPATLRWIKAGPGPPGMMPPVDSTGGTDGFDL